jgi:hypothetical protein
MHATRDAQAGKNSIPDTRDSAQVRGWIDGQMLEKMLVVETESSLSAMARVNLSVQRREK